jgi:O-antigen ligase
MGLAVITSQFSIATSSVGIGGLVILTVFRLITAWQEYTQEYTIDKNLLFLFGAFITVQVISSFLADSPAESFDHIYRKISIYVIFFACILFFTSRQIVKNFLIVFILFTALISIVELVRFFIHPGQTGVPLSEYRLNFFGYPATNGQIKMMILLVIIPFLLVKKNYLMGKLYLLLLILPVLLTFYLTNARNALLGLFAGLIILGALKNRIFLAALFVVTGSFILLAPLTVKERMLSIADLDHPSNSSRIIMWETGVKMIKDAPLFGYGDVNIKNIYSRYRYPELHGEGSHMHNNVIQILVNFGILGLLSWFALMVYIFIKQIGAFKKTKGDEFLNLLAVISITSMAALHVCGLTEWNFGDAEFAAVFWFNLALAFIAVRLKVNSTNG